MDHANLGHCALVRLVWKREGGCTLKHPCAVVPTRRQRLPGLDVRQRQPGPAAHVDACEEAAGVRAQAAYLGNTPAPQTLLALLE